MPSLVGTAIAANYLKHQGSQSGVGKEYIVSVTKASLTDAELGAVINNITLPGGEDGTLPNNTGDAFTIGGVGTVDGAAIWTAGTSPAMLRVQGNGTFDTTDAAGTTGATVAVVAVFEPAR